MAHVTFDFEGFRELEDVFTEIENDLGEKDAKRIIRRAMKAAMQPVLIMAKAEALKDTGALAASLQIEVRKPTKKDKGSKYVSYGDKMIAAVTTASGKKLAKTEWTKAHKSNRGEITHFTKEKGIPSDARAIAVEFGTARMDGKPFLRPALEDNRTVVVDELALQLRTALEKFKARPARKVRRR